MRKNEMVFPKFLKTRTPTMVKVCGVTLIIQLMSCASQRIKSPREIPRNVNSFTYVTTEEGKKRKTSSKR